MIARGDIRWFRFDNPDKRRPVLVVGRAELVDQWSLLPVIPLSTQARGLSWEVHLGPEDGLPSPCVLKPEWIRAVERTKLGPRIGVLATRKWAAVRDAVVQALGLGDGEP